MSTVREHRRIRRGLGPVQAKGIECCYILLCSLPVSTVSVLKKKYLLLWVLFMVHRLSLVVVHIDFFFALVAAHRLSSCGPWSLEYMDLRVLRLL